MTIRFQIGGHSEEFVQSQLSSGRYSDADEVIRDALRMMEERERALVAHKDILAKQIEAGYRSLREGRYEDGETFITRLDDELDAIDRAS